MTHHEKLIQLLDILLKIRSEAEAEGAIIMVEGKKDIAALSALGFQGEIRPLNRGHPVLEVAEELARKKKKVIILFDWDRTGRALSSKLASYLKGLDANYDLELRRELSLAVRARVKDVEGIDSYLRDLLSNLHLPFPLATILDRYQKKEILH